jgi:hypothetical protein
MLMSVRASVNACTHGYVHGLVYKPSQLPYCLTTATMSINYLCGVGLAAGRRSATPSEIVVSSKTVPTCTYSTKKRETKQFQLSLLLFHFPFRSKFKWGRSSTCSCLKLIFHKTTNDGLCRSWNIRVSDVREHVQ